MESRSKKSARNILTGFVSKILLMVFAFSTKTIFVRLLGVEYNGVNGLYSNILSILALSELGLGNVLNYTLYQALRENNEKKIRSIVKYFKKVYLLIALSVSCVGILLIPLLPYIVKTTLPQKEVILYYLLYLLNSVASYFVVYKTTVISADQNNYITNICETFFTFIMYILQIVYLLLCKDFLGYLIIQVLCTVLKNLVLSRIADRRYPYLKEGEIVSDAFNKEILIENIKSTFLYKIAAVILNNTDNILISIMVGTVFVGYYSNYYMIVTYIAAFVSIFITGITASLGNLNAAKDREASYNMFNMLTLIFSFIGTIVACCFLNCMQGFIPIWLGKENVMPFSWVIAIVINNYVNEIMSPVWMFRETMGLFKQVRYLMLITAGLNLIFSIGLGALWGVPGVLLATVLAKLVSQYWYEPRLLFKQQFEKPVKNFFLNQAKQILACLVSAIGSYIVCGYIGSTIIGIIMRAIISSIIAVIVVFVVNCRSDAWKALYSRYIKRK